MFTEYTVPRTGGGYTLSSLSTFLCTFIRHFVFPPSVPVASAGHRIGLVQSVCVSSVPFSGRRCSSGTVPPFPLRLRVFGLYVSMRMGANLSSPLYNSSVAILEFLWNHGLVLVLLFLLFFFFFSSLSSTDWRFPLCPCFFWLA